MTLAYADRQKLHIRTIGSVNVKKRARTELRKRSKRLAEVRWPRLSEFFRVDKWSICHG
jgi:hypothetical protein